MERTCTSERVVQTLKGKIQWPCIIRTPHKVHQDAVGWTWQDDVGREWKL